MTNTVDPSELEKAQDLFKQARTENVQKCGDEIQKVLLEFGCTIVPQFIFRGMQMIPGWLVVPISKDAPPSRVISSNEK